MTTAIVQLTYMFVLIHHFIFPTWTLCPSSFFHSCALIDLNNHFPTYEVGVLTIELKAHSRGQSEVRTRVAGFADLYLTTQTSAPINRKTTFGFEPKLSPIEDVLPITP